MVSVLGPNGCGKSTLMKIICNLLKPENGCVNILGKMVEQISLNDLARNIAYVSQSNYAVFSYSVYEIVMMGRTPYLNLLGFEKTDDKEIVFDAMKKMEIDHLAGKGISELSGGEAQRVYIARALAQQAKIILLDEPNAHMDLEHQVRTFELLKKINKEEGTTILSVSHDLNFVGIYFDRIIVLQSGKIIYDGDKSEILTKEKIKQVFNVDVTIQSPKENIINVIVNPT